MKLDKEDIFLFGYMCYNVIINLRHTLKIRGFKLYLSLVFLVGSFGQVSGQSVGSSFIRHMNGVTALEAGAGLSDIGIAVYGYYGWYISHQWSIKTGGAYEFDLDQRFDSRTISLDLAINKYLLARRKFFLGAMLGPTLAFEHLEGVEWDGKFLHPLPGVAWGVGIDDYLTRRFAVSFNGVMRMIPASEIGKIRLYLLAGLKYTLRN
tara:strand:- start:540 stop:1160 length:621 start_codon:yes stop_codon:yes gene_type:complete